MADQEITKLVELTSVDVADLLAIVDDPSGGASTKKITVANLLGALTAANIGAILYDITTDETNAGLIIADLDRQFEPYESRRYKMIEDGGITDNATPFANAIKAADQSGENLKIIGGNSFFDVGSAITQASLTNPLKIIGVGIVEIRYSGAATNFVLQITDTNGNDVTFDNIIINANSLAATCVRVDNPSANMNDASIGMLKVKDCFFKNGLLKTGQTFAATGLTAVGGFSEVILDNLNVRNVNRETGAGTAGSIGCAGALISFDDINAYVKKLTVIGGHIDTVTNNEAGGSGDNVDCDGIIYSVETAANNSNLHVAASMTLWGTKFSNCKGRCVKTAVDGFTIIRDVTIVRDLEAAIVNAVDFDFQRGGGLIDGVVYYANEVSGGGTVWGTSHAIFAYQPDQGATTANSADGGFTCRNVTVYNAIPVATDVLPFFGFVINGDTSRELTAVKVKDCAIVGGAISRWIKNTTSSTSQDLNLTLEGLEGNVQTSVIQFTGDTNANTRLSISQCRNFGTATTPDLIEVKAASFPPYLSGYNNTGFNIDLIAQEAGDVMGEIFRPALIGGDSITGHAFAPPQTITLADDASHAFNATGLYGIGIITSNFNETTQVIFAHDNGTILEIFQTGATSAAVTVGTTTNPDVDGDLNIWITGNDAINIKNRLGSQQIFHFFHFGGS